MESSGEPTPSWDEIAGLSFDEIIGVLNRASASDCSMCGYGEYEVLGRPDDSARPGLFKIPVQAEGNRYLPCYAVSCKNCGNTHFLQAMGLWRLHKHGPRVKEEGQA